MKFELLNQYKVFGINSVCTIDILIRVGMSTI